LSALLGASDREFDFTKDEHQYGHYLP
jgi:hypothetical protein